MLEMAIMIRYCYEDDESLYRMIIEDATEVAKSICRRTIVY